MKTRSYLLLMLVAIILPVMFLSALGLSMLLQSERESRIRTIKEMAHSASQLVDSDIAVAEATIRNIANSQDLLDDHFAQVHRLLTATARSPLTWTLVADYEGNGLLNTLVPYGTPLRRSSGDWAAKVYDQQRTVVSGYFFGSMAKRGVVSVNVPVPAQFGKKYVVTQIFDPDYFSRVFSRNAIGANWIIGIFDANGVSIARNVNTQTMVGKPVRAALFDATRSAANGAARHVTREGVEVYDMFARSAVTGWTVAIGVPVAEIESAARMTTWLAAVALLAVLGAAVAMAVFFGRRIDVSINNAITAAQALAQGQVAPATHSHLQEVNVLLDVLHRTSVALTKESRVRQVLEREREQLLEMETEARLRAEADNAAKDTFISMLSHELRNPLAAITGAVAVVRLPQLAAAKVDKAWQVIERQLSHLSRMVEDLLDVRRVLSGKIVLRHDRIDIGALVRFCCDSRAIGPATSHQWQVDTRIAWVLGDKTRLEQIIDNLLVNAIKFSAPGSRITVKNYVVDQTVLIEVQDEGVGIGADVLPTIFESLVQAPTAIDRAKGGLGLGLSIAKGLVEMHGGTISAHSAGLGAGSVFIVSLPAAA